MIGLNYEGGDTDSDTAKVKQYVTSEGINYPCALGDDATQNQVPGFNGYPTTLFIDKTGKVRHRLVGLHQYQDLSYIRCVYHLTILNFCLVTLAYYLLYLITYCHR